MPAVLGQICREIGWIRPALTLWTGDRIYGCGDTPAEADGEYDAFLKSAALTGAPLFNVPGNHEFAPDPDLLPVYKRRMGPLQGSFDYVLFTVGGVRAAPRSSRPGTRRWTPPPVPLGHITVRLAAPPAGRALAVTAVEAYKKKARAVSARPVSARPDAAGGVDAVVAATLPPAHTVAITVAPAPK